MNVIDFHVHVGKREHLISSFMDYFIIEYGTEALKAMEALTPETFGTFLRAQGVDKAVLLSEYSPKVTGVVPNEFTVEFARGDTSLVPFGSIDINASIGCGVQAEHALKYLGCRGLKLLPPYGHYYPDDSRMYPAYEVAQSLDSIVMFHTGTSLFPNSRIRFADPLLLDDVANDFPRLRILMCHGGRPFWYKQAEWMLRRHSNLHIDISGIPPAQIPDHFPKLEQYYDRFVFGSDWPNLWSIKSQVEQVRRLPYNPEVTEAILWRNASRLLGLEL